MTQRQVCPSKCIDGLIDHTYLNGRSEMSVTFQGINSSARFTNQSPINGPKRFHHRLQRRLADPALHIVNTERHDDALTGDRKAGSKLDAGRHQLHRLARRFHLSARIDEVPRVPVELLTAHELHLMRDAEPAFIADAHELRSTTQ